MRRQLHLSAIPENYNFLLIEYKTSFAWAEHDLLIVHVHVSALQAAIVIGGHVLYADVFVNTVNRLKG